MFHQCSLNDSNVSWLLSSQIYFRNGYGGDLVHLGHIIYCTKHMIWPKKFVFLNPDWPKSYYTIHVCILNLHFTFQILPKDNQQVWRSFFWSVIMLLLLNSNNNNNLTDFNRKMKCNYLPTYQTWMSLIFMFSWKIFIKVSGKMRRGTEERLIV